MAAGKHSTVAEPAQRVPLRTSPAGSLGTQPPTGMASTREKSVMNSRRNTLRRLQAQVQPV